MKTRDLSRVTSCPAAAVFGDPVTSFRAVAMAHPSAVAGGNPVPGAGAARPAGHAQLCVTPQAGQREVRVLMPGERHTTPENIAKFFDPVTYKRSQAVSQNHVRRAASPSASASDHKSKKPRMAKKELIAKFMLAAELNGIEWEDLAVPWLSFCFVLCSEAEIAPSSSGSTTCPTDVASVVGGETVGDTVEVEALNDEDAMMEALENQTELELNEAIASEQAAVRDGEGDSVERPSEPPALQISEPATAKPSEPPAVHPSELPAVQPLEPAIAKPVEPPAVQPLEPAAAKVSEPAVAKPSEPPAAKPFEPPVAQISEPPAAKPLEPPVAQISEPPAAKPLEPPVAQISEPAQSSDVLQGSEKAEASGQGQKETPQEVPVKVPSTEGMDKFQKIMDKPLTLDDLKLIQEVWESLPANSRATMNANVQQQTPPEPVQQQQPQEQAQTAQQPLANQHDGQTQQVEQPQVQQPKAAEPQHNHATQPQERAEALQPPAHAVQPVAGQALEAKAPLAQPPSQASVMPPPNALPDVVKSVAEEQRKKVMSMTAEDAAKLGLATSTTHRTEYMKFLRSAGSDGNNRGKSAEMFGLKGASRTELFNMWIVAGHDFCKVNMIIQQKLSNTLTAGAKRVFLSKKQLQQSGKYTEEQITELIKRCVQQKLYQDDPNFPGNEELRQYEVVNEVSKSNTHSVEVSQLIQGVSQLSSQEARSLTEAGQTEILFLVCVEVAVHREELPSACRATLHRLPVSFPT